jgi:hypothetical protein
MDIRDYPMKVLLTVFSILLLIGLAQAQAQQEQQQASRISW